MISQDEARARVARGVTYLDEAKPGWVNRLNTDRLDLGDECLCVLGQLYGDYGEAMNQFGWKLSQAPSGFYMCSDSVARGFGIAPEDADGLEIQWPLMANINRAFRVLQDAWIEAIAARLHPVSEAIPTETPVTA